MQWVRLVFYEMSYGLSVQERENFFSRRPGICQTTTENLSSTFKTVKHVVMRCSVNALLTTKFLTRERTKRTTYKKAQLTFKRTEILGKLV